MSSRKNFNLGSLKRLTCFHQRLIPSFLKQIGQTYNRASNSTHEQLTIKPNPFQTLSHNKGGTSNFSRNLVVEKETQLPTAKCTFKGHRVRAFVQITSGGQHLRTPGKVSSSSETKFECGKCRTCPRYKHQNLTLANLSVIPSQNGDISSSNNTNTTKPATARTETCTIKVDPSPNTSESLPLHSNEITSHQNEKKNTTMFEKIGQMISNPRDDTNEEEEEDTCSSLPTLESLAFESLGITGYQGERGREPYEIEKVIRRASRNLRHDTVIL